MGIPAFSLEQPMKCAELTISGTGNDKNVVALSATKRYVAWGYAIFGGEAGKIVLHHDVVANISDDNRIGGWNDIAAGSTGPVFFNRPVIGPKGVDIHASVTTLTAAVLWLWYTEIE